MLGVFFLFNHFLPIETIVFDIMIFFPIEDIDFLSSNLKSYFTSDNFLKSSGGLKNTKLATFWTNLYAL